ncbi:MAG: Hsp70 family protein [Cyanobacteriota bacterium]|nr:Hsp70 family protein [Cyanobacteriota bacterium]
MATVVGIDLGTTNSLVAALEAGQPWVIPDAAGDLLLPSVVGVTPEGQLLVGQAAQRQYAAAPERTVRSIKRQMGGDTRVTLGEESFRPQEISALILRTLRQRAEEVLNDSVTQAVITVPAYFTDAQRQATKEAGEIAGLEVLQILNEPTAAALVFDRRDEESQRLLVYDLGGGTFDVSIVEITGPVTEVLASHGNNRLGGDDFDRRLQRLLVERFERAHGVSLPSDPALEARLLQAAERAKMQLSEQERVVAREAYLHSQGDTPLHLETELLRSDFEDLIRPLLSETLESIDRALSDADLQANDLDRVVLVGGSTRIPLVAELVEAHLKGVAVSSFEPDRCVALGAALQAGVLNGEELDTLLVDVTPHSLGIATAIESDYGLIPDVFSTIIPRNTVIPVVRSKVYSTTIDFQKIVRVEVSQGENVNATENVPLGFFDVEGLPALPAGEVSIDVRFSFDLNGILTVTASETSTGLQRRLVVNNATTHRLASHELERSRDAVDSLFASLESMSDHPDDDVAAPRGDLKEARRDFEEADDHRVAADDDGETTPAEGGPKG